MRIETDCQVSRKCPRSCRPDKDADFFPRQCRIEFRRIRKWELDVDRVTRMVTVFDFRLSQRRLAVNAPVHWAQALVDRPFLDESAENTDDLRLVLGVHRQVRVFPFSEDAQTFEITALQVNVLFRMLAGSAADFDDRHFMLLRPKFLLDFYLNR